ncbi:DUF2892 domain-containing protein [Aureivirga sp. CE67]|uniref:YgaP family membrane protein n=1 Tax=Aureivirga sp. CE67 TaxID=1788983 RepID=UPI0018CB28FD|nr:DUF2892 domain-containing protein [Aureivirga sp. CE67]
MQNRIVRGFAGSMILISILLSHYVNSAWIFLAVFVGLNLLQNAFTKWCLLEIILTKLKVAK